MKKKIPVKKRERKLVVPDSKPILKDLKVNVQKQEFSKLTNLKAYSPKRVGRPAMKKAMRSVFSRDHNIESQPILSIMKIQRNGNFLIQKFRFLYVSPLRTKLTNKSKLKVYLQFLNSGFIFQYLNFSVNQ